MVTGTSAEAGTAHTREEKPTENELWASPLDVNSHIQQKSHLTPEASSTMQKSPCATLALLGKRCCWDAKSSLMVLHVLRRGQEHPQSQCAGCHQGQW